MPKTRYKACQKPRIDIYTPGDTRKAELLFRVMDAYGTKLYDWQKLVLRRWLAEDKSGKFVNLECGLSVPRQNGKTELIVVKIIYSVIFGPRTVLFTAHKQKTVDTVKKRVQDFFYDNPSRDIFNLLADRFRKERLNYDFIDFDNGSTCKFITRTRMAGLGETVDDLINDESAEMQDAHQSALMSTTSAAKSGNPQIIYCGTPPTAETVSEVFPRVRKGIKDSGEGAWTEWGVEVMTDPSDESAWYKTNPSLDKSLLKRLVRAESRSLSKDNFNRMRLGWWVGVEDKRAITQKYWNACYTEKPEFDDEYMPVYAVKFSPNRSDYSLAVAQPLKNGKIHVEIVLQRPMNEGVSKITSWLKERYRKCAKIIIDGATGQALLFEDLVSVGVPKKKIVQPNMVQIAAAHEFALDGIVHNEFSHYSQPLLNQTVSLTKQRSLNRHGGFGWESMSSNLSTAAIDAATYAYWGQKVFSKKAAQRSGSEASDKQWRDILSSL